MMGEIDVSKCVLYSDNICRKGNKDRNCLACYHTEYKSLYKLNYDNQERLEKKLQQLKQENATLNSRLEKIKEVIDVYRSARGCSDECYFAEECAEESWDCTELQLDLIAQIIDGEV